MPLFYLATRDLVTDPSLNGRYFVRRSPRTLPNWMRDQRNTDAVFARFEADAGITLKDAMAL